MYKNTLCLICDDKRHYETKVHEAERIQRFLSRYAEPIKQKTDKQLLMNLSMDHRHHSFMCGGCPKVDSMKLKNKERLLADTVYGICEKIKSGEQLPIHTILRALQGYYPIMYRCVERVAKQYKNQKTAED